ncbi:MAG: cobalt-precorrin 5A hydrolase [Actinobacteria bacterium]|nr:cobalt-precorrin 5A hydrolase [Actinomycetota bacterium]
MKIAAIAFSDTGMTLGERLLGCADFDLSLTRCGDGELAAWTSGNFSSAEALLFIGSTGIAVRAIAPHVNSKTTDPAVVVIDELGRYAIPILSGHIGGANALAISLSESIGAVPVITTATDINSVFAVDTWAKNQGLAIANPEGIKRVSAKLLAGKTVGIKSLLPIDRNLPAGVAFDDEAYDILVSYRTDGSPDALRLIPPIITVGIGCRKGIEADAIEDAVEAALAKAHCSRAAICRVCSIDLKADEPGLLEFCKWWNLPFRTFAASELAAVEGEFTASVFVQGITGVDNVCERAALLGSNGGRLLEMKEAGNGVTVALAINEPTLRLIEG